MYMETSTCCIASFTAACYSVFILWYYFKRDDACFLLQTFIMYLCSYSITNESKKLHLWNKTDGLIHVTLTITSDVVTELCSLDWKQVITTCLLRTSK